MGYNATSNSQPVNWPSLHGADYLWTGVYEYGNPPAPAQSFASMRSYGFNLIRVPLSWNMMIANPTQYEANLQQIASYAQSNGIYVMYQFQGGTNGGGGCTGWSYPTSVDFPSALLNQYSNQCAFYDAWWANTATLNGQSAWTAMANQFWIPLINTVKGYASTLGFSAMNEPSFDFSTGGYAITQPYNQFVYNTVRQYGGSSFYVAYDAKGGTDPSTADMLAAAPKGTNVVYDWHDYFSAGQYIDNIGSVARQNGILLWIGEYHFDNTQTTPTYFAQYYTTFKNNNAPSTAWEWSCYAPEKSSHMLNSNNNCQIYPAVSEMQQAWNQVYGSGGGTTFSFSTSSFSSMTTSRQVSTTSQTNITVNAENFNTIPMSPTLTVKNLSSTSVISNIGYNSTALEISLKTPGAVAIVLHVNQKPSQVYADSTSISSWNYDPSTNLLKITADPSSITVVFASSSPGPEIYLAILAVVILSVLVAGVLYLRRR